MGWKLFEQPSAKIPPGRKLFQKHFPQGRNYCRTFPPRGKYFKNICPFKNISPKGGNYLRIFPRKGWELYKLKAFSPRVAIISRIYPPRGEYFNNRPPATKRGNYFKNIPPEGANYYKKISPKGGIFSEYIPQGGIFSKNASPGGGIILRTFAQGKIF